MSERIFDMGKGIQIVCRFVKTRSAFKHTAVVFKDGRDVFETKVCYQNRTWESYEFQTVLIKAIQQCDIFTKEEKTSMIEYAKANRTDYSGFETIAHVAKMGEFFAKTPEEKNSWKQRMIKAGLGENIQFPEGWNDLSEQEKEKRLNSVIAVMEKKEASE